MRKTKAHPRADSLESTPESASPQPVDSTHTSHTAPSSDLPNHILSADAVVSDDKIESLSGEICPVCLQKTLTLTDIEKEIPYFGKVFIYSMTCSNAECKFHKSDVEPAQQQEPSVLSFLIDSEKDMSVRVVKSAAATVKLGRIMTIDSNEFSNGYVSNIEGVLVRAKKILEEVRDTAEEDEQKNQAKKHLKKLLDVQWGHDSLELTIDDPNGASAIVSPKTIVKPLKSKKKKSSM
jgi:ZPR1-related zinc finger protein